MDLTLMLEEALQLAYDDTDNAFVNSGKGRKDKLNTSSKMITSIAKLEERHLQTVKV